MKKISRHTYVALIAGLLIILANSWHVLTEFFRNTPTERFTGIAHYVGDFFLYVSFIAQGARGAWFLTDHVFTNETLNPTWIYWLYTLLGKISFIGLNPFYLYNISIALFAGALLFLWWKILHALFPQDPAARLLAFIFIITASNFPGMGDFWFSPTPALNRLGGVPHQIFQSILMVSVILLFHHRKYMLLAAVAALAATANPIQMLLLGLALTVTKPITILYLLPAALGAILTTMTFAGDPILTAAKTWEDGQRVSVGLWQFILAMGPIVFFLPFGVRDWIRERSPIARVFLLFGLFSLGTFFSPIPAALGTTSVRWLSPVSYAILPVVAASGLFILARLIRNSSGNRIPGAAVTAGIFALYALLTVPPLRIQVQQRLSPLRTEAALVRLNHIPRADLAALETVGRYPEKSVVLTDPALPYDIAVPVFTGKPTFTGHPIHTLYPQTKAALRERFFQGVMDETEARKFLADHLIGSVLTTTQTLPVLSRYPFLRREAETGAIVILAVTL